MARLRSRVERAAEAHRRAAAVVAAAEVVLDSFSPSSAAADHFGEQHDLAARLRADAAALAPGWLGAPLDALAPGTPVGGPLVPTFVRVGVAHPLDDASFSVIVPLLRAGHIAIDADARDQRVAGLLRSLVVRLLASAPADSIVVRTVDAAGTGVTFEALAQSPPAVDADGLRAALDEAEHWLAARGDAGPTLLLVIASLPELTDGNDLNRIAALAHAGPAGRLHLLAAGWPPPPLTAETTQAPLPHATQIALRNPYCWIGDPPGATFAADGVGPGRLNAPVYLDPEPPPELVAAVAGQLRTATPGAAGEPSRAAWMEYLAAAQRLDAVRRAATAVVAEQTTALEAARQELTRVRAKLASLTPSGDPPTPAESAAAIAALQGHGPAGVTSVLRQTERILDVAERDMSIVEHEASTRLGRNAAVYAAFGSLAAITQVPVLLLLRGSVNLAVVATPCALTLPVVAFALSWLVIGLLAKPDEGGRHAPLGAAISLIALVPIIAYFAGWGLSRVFGA